MKRHSGLAAASQTGSCGGRRQPRLGGAQGKGGRYPQPRLLIDTRALLLAGTAALAVHARLRLIPILTDENLSGLAWHIRGITALAIAFVVVGGLIRLGGLG